MGMNGIMPSRQGGNDMNVELLVELVILIVRLVAAGSWD
jgi:hypothetical protein